MKHLFTSLLAVVALTASAQTEANPFDLKVGSNEVTGMTNYTTNYFTYTAETDQIVKIEGVNAYPYVKVGTETIPYCYLYNEEVLYFAAKAGTTYNFNYYFYGAGSTSVKFDVSYTSQAYTDGLSCDNAVVIGDNAAFVPFFGPSYGANDNFIYMKYTPKIDGRLEMNFTTTVSNYQYAEGCDGTFTALGGSSISGAWMAYLEVEAGVEYVFKGVASSGMIASFKTIEIRPGVSCMDAIRLSDGSYEIPAETGSIWYSFKAPSEGFAVLSSGDDLSGVKTVIRTSCSSTYDNIEQENGLNVRISLPINTERVFSVEHDAELASALTFNYKFEYPQAYDSQNTAPEINVDETVTVPDFGGSYFYSITAPASGDYFLDVLAGITVPNGTYVELYEENLYRLRGTNSLHYNVTPGKKYVIKWYIPNHLAGLDFNFKADFNAVKQGDTATDPLPAALGENTVPESADVFFLYPSKASSWLILTPAEGTPVPTIGEVINDSWTKLTPYNDNGSYRFEAKADAGYRFEFVGAVNGGKFDLATRDFAVGESQLSPFIVDGTDASMPEEVGTFWFQYDAPKDGMLIISTTVPYATTNSIYVYRNKVIDDANYRTKMTYETYGGTTYKDVTLYVSEGDVIIIRAKVGTAYEDKVFSFNYRDAYPGEIPQSAVHIDFNENPMTYEFKCTVGWNDAPYWFSIDLDGGIFNLLLESGSFSVYMYTDTDTETPLTYANGSYWGAGEIKNLALPYAGLYYLKVTSASRAFTGKLSEREAEPGETTGTAFLIQPTEVPYTYDVEKLEVGDSRWYAIKLKPGDFKMTLGGYTTCDLYKGSNLKSVIASSHYDSETLNNIIVYPVVEEDTYYIKLKSCNADTEAVFSGSAVMLESESGLEVVDAADTEAVYYNLQGVRVAEPSNGLFIRVRGNKTDKVIVR